MKSELIVDVQPAEVSAALLEDGRLVSLQKEARNIQYSVGDIYLAKVKKLMPGLNAAFVNVGYEKDAFLHYLDLGAHFATYAEFLKQLFADRKTPPQTVAVQTSPRYRQAWFSFRGAYSRSGIARADCQRADFIQRPAPYH